jgi:hypothetical protein
MVASFEDGGLDGWAAGGGTGIAKVSNSTTKAYDGTHSLAVTLTKDTQTNWASVYIANPAWLKPGQTVTVHVQVPSGAPTGLQASVFVQAAGSPSSWNEGPATSLTPGTWTTLTYTVPTTVSITSPDYMGVRFYPKSTTGTWTGTAYVDGISYQ